MIRSKRLSLLIPAAGALLLAACASPEANPESTRASLQGHSNSASGEGYAEAHKPEGSPDAEAGFAQHWYNGTAELNAYDLQQERYGQIRRGDAVLIFVTEDFHARDHVKLDRAPKDPEDAVKVLKLNAVRNFETGVYAYKTMQSVFTPVQLNRHAATLKSTTSVQEWCGMVFQQLNRSSKGFDARWYSYFQSEGDGSTALADALLEDEVFNRIRLAPESLPIGPTQALPSSLDIRLYHLPVKPLDAEGRLEDLPDGERRYTLRYSDGTELRVRFGADFPRPILGWEKDRNVGGQQMTTKATRRSVEQWPYWRYNNLEDTTFRRQLGL